jgi:2-polyprenyl-3-methyl-5-hydroxy-6-metoxy-1,4-benzoquinol methylase
MDLSIPQYGILQYDWIISLEVAEHIPEIYEAVYLDNIFRHAKEGIILSWAVPGQGGLSHINNKCFVFIS